MSIICQSDHTNEQTLPTVINRIYRLLSRAPVWALLVIVAVWTLPSVTVVVDSFRSSTNQRRRGWWTIATDPDQLTLDNYDYVLTQDAPVSMFDSLINSFGIAIPATIIPIVLAAVAAYALAFMDFKGREGLYLGMVSLIAVPVQVALIPLLTTFVHGAHLTMPFTEKTITVLPDLDVNARGNLAVWLTLTGMAIPFAIFILHNTFATLPRDLVDSARIDGADHVTMFWRVVLPLSFPAFASLAILQFLWSWNEFLIPQIMTSGGDPSNQPSTVRLANLSGEAHSAGPVAAAAMLIQVAVPLLVFFGLQRHIVRGLLVGSVNG